ncbi:MULTISPECIES: hypothetical protein [unclassified Streptomyces]|nr:MULTISPECIES: hypothetical protein [unclassified Streptomyces]MCX4879236.1 hypothetical protein [Streptomyces sp. NBC_00847]MCX5419183.1 hypothetical protein [Streptomyces sp. NBC_00078]
MRSLPNPFDAAGRMVRYALGTAGSVADRVVPAVTAAVLDRLDLDGLAARIDVNRIADRVDVMRVARRLDIDLVADRVDVDRVADRVDIERVAARMDVNSVAARLDADTVAARIDVDRIAARIDVDRIAARLDVDAVIDRIDLVALTRAVLEEIDLGRIVRDTSGGMAEETVDALRLSSARADRMVDRVTDRLLHRPGAAPKGTDGLAPPHGQTP